MKSKMMGIDDFSIEAKHLGIKLDFDTNVDYSWAEETIHTITYSKEGITYLVVQVIITVDEYNYIRICDTNKKLLREDKIPGATFDFNVFEPILNFITEELNKKIAEFRPKKLETIEKVEINHDNGGDKHYLYKVKKFSISTFELELERELNKMAKEGWELYTSMVYNFSKDSFGGFTTSEGIFIFRK